MINCRECIEFLMAYLDGELPAEQRARFDEHLRLCPPCVEYLESYKQAVAMAKTCGRDASPAPAAKPLPVPERLVSAILSSMGKGGEGEGGKGGGCCCPR